MSARRWVPPVAWAAFILVLTSLPGADLPSVAVRHIDKVVHFTLYGVFGWLLARALLIGRRARLAIVIAVLGVSLFGAADEWHQQFIPGRSMELFDWVADTAGALIGASAAAAAAAARRLA